MPHAVDHTGRLFEQGGETFGGIFLSHDGGTTRDQRRRLVGYSIIGLWAIRLSVSRTNGWTAGSSAASIWQLISEAYPSWELRHFGAAVVVSRPGLASEFDAPAEK